MPESPVQSRRTTWSGKYSISLSATPDTPWSKTSARASISRGRDFYPFWNESRKDSYHGLWLPARTDCVVSDSIFFQRHGVELVVLDQEDKSPESELAEDVLAVIQVFGCRWNGKRRYGRRTDQDPKSQTTPQQGSEETPRCLEARS